MRRLIDADSLLEKLKGYLAPREYDELDEVRNAFVYNCIEEVEIAIAKAEEDMTRGDKIRQSNESLVEFIEDMPRNICNIQEDGILEWLNSPAESEEE